MLIAQITDCHVTLPGQKPEDVYRTSVHLERWVARLNALDPRPDLVLATGDLVHLGSREEYDRLRSILAPLEIPVFLIPGNHDDRANLASVFADHDYLPRDGFLQYAVEDHPLRLIALDTLLPGEIGGLLCEARLAWLAARLEEAAERPTVIFMHHPPFLTGVPVMDALDLEGREAFVEVIGKHRNIEAILCGHLHRPINRRLAGTIASTCPATAHQIALDFADSPRPRMTTEPPAGMLHLWLGSGGGLVSHIIYLDDGEASEDTPT